jgi:hypothetical protein
MAFNFTNLSLIIGRVSLRLLEKTQSEILAETSCKVGLLTQFQKR